MPLTDTAVKNAKSQDKQYKLTDSLGMYLLIKPNGGKYWRFKYRVAGKENLLSIGVYPEVSLKEARDKRDEARKQLRDGIDPSQAKKDEKHQTKLKSENSFEAVSREWHQNQTSRWTPRHAHYVIRRLELDIFPALGHRQLEEITAPELLAVLRTIENRDAIDIAKRLLQTCGQIFRYGVATGRASRDISADLKGALKTRKQTNFARLKEDELPQFLATLEAYDGELQTKLAIKLLLHTFVRTTELRGAKWEEINIEKAEWRIPAERMKMRDPHIVPLSTQAIALLKQLQAISGNREFVFPNRNKPTHFMSENTMLYAIYRMGYHSRTTAHGFRATASTILNEHGFNADVIERQLAHAERNKVRASYNHAQYLPERKKMMQWWGEYLEKVS